MPLVLEAPGAIPARRAVIHIFAIRPLIVGPSADLPSLSEQKVVEVVLIELGGQEEAPLRQLVQLNTMVVMVVAKAAHGVALAVVAQRDHLVLAVTAEIQEAEVLVEVVVMVVVLQELMEVVIMVVRVEIMPAVLAVVPRVILGLLAQMVVVVVVEILVLIIVAVREVMVQNGIYHMEVAVGVGEQEMATAASEPEEMGGSTAVVAEDLVLIQVLLVEMVSPA